MSFEASQIPFNVGAQAPQGKSSHPGPFGGLHRRFDETLLRPAPRYLPMAAIPKAAAQNSPAGGHRWARVVVRAR